MAFDIYAGTFVRFYTRNWENVIQKQAKLQGTKYTMIYSGGDAGPPTAENVCTAVTAWKQGINAALSHQGLGPIEWSEDDEQPYFTDRPSWEGYFAIQQWAAHLEKPNFAVPYALSKNPTESAVLSAVLNGDDHIHFLSILRGSVWLPGDFDFLFNFPFLTEGEAMIGSTGRLLQELRELKGKPLKWGKKPFLSFGKKEQIIPFQDIAQWVLPVFERVVEQGHAAKLPFMLSF